ncbi:MAG TPA: RNA methyltransferase, partial [Bacteroidales bacterium]
MNNAFSFVPLSNALYKRLSQLHDKKFRKEYKQFIVSGDKLVRELLVSGLKIDYIIAEAGWLQEIDKRAVQRYTCYAVDEAVLKKLSGQVTPNRVMAVLPLFAHAKAVLPSKNERIIALDCIQDPGNLGTIIRLADWFGIDHIVCSNDCADFYNPKVIQSTMGAFLRVKVHYTNLESYLQEARNANVPVYGAFLKGENI